MGSAVGIGQFASWDGGGLVLSRVIGWEADVIPLHSHYAIQIAFGSEPGIRFRTSERGGWAAYGGVVIPSRLPHAMDASTVPLSAVLFVEPETREGRALAERFLRGGVLTALPEELAAELASVVFSAWREDRSAPAVADAARRVIRELTGGVEPSVVSDERILRAVAYINRNLDAPLTLEEIAAEVYLSPSRFRHLFVEQTGVALRPYILWRRFVRVWELLMAGESLSTAAHRAGFADAAHLTRTSRRMFGFPPSALQMASRL